MSLRGGAGTIYLQDVFQLITDINIFLVVVDLRVMGDEGVLGSDVDGVVDLPVDVSDLPGRMEETLEAPAQTLGSLVVFKAKNTLHRKQCI